MSQCLHPRYVQTPSGLRKVPCGKCSACLNKKGIRNACYIDVEHLSSGYAMFGTLTYCNYFLPIVRVDYDERTATYFCNPYNRRLIEDNYGGSLYSFKSSEFNGHDESVWSQISSRTKLPRKFVPVIYVRDFQLYQKRFKQYLIRNLNILPEHVEKIRYYYCGEYGTKHYRPHFHFILFVPEDIRYVLTPERLREAVCSSWNFGRIDFQRSKGKNSSYLAEYLNGNSTLTAFHRLHEFRQRSRHSNHFAEAYFPSKPSEIVRNVAEGASVSYYVCGGKLKHVLPPSSIEHSKFPKCLHYSMLLPQQRLSAYLSYEYALGELCPRWYPPLAAAREILNRGFNSPTFRILFGIYGYSIMNESTLYGLFYCSQRFLKVCKIYDYSIYDYLSLIERYYNCKELTLLFNQYEQQAAFVDEYVINRGVPENIYFLTNFYDNFIFSDSPEDNVHKYKVSSVEYRFLWNLAYGLNLCDDIDSSIIHYKNNPQYKEDAQSSEQLWLDKVKHKHEAQSSSVDFINDKFNSKYYYYG